MLHFEDIDLTPGSAETLKAIGRNQPSRDSPPRGAASARICIPEPIPGIPVGGTGQIRSGGWHRADLFPTPAAQLHFGNIRRQRADYRAPCTGQALYEADPPTPVRLQWVAPVSVFRALRWVAPGTGQALYEADRRLRCDSGGWHPYRCSGHYGGWHRSTLGTGTLRSSPPDSGATPVGGTRIGVPGITVGALRWVAPEHSVGGHRDRKERTGTGQIRSGGWHRADPKFVKAKNTAYTPPVRETKQFPHSQWNWQEPCRYFIPVSDPGYAKTDTSEQKSPDDQR